MLVNYFNNKLEVGSHQVLYLRVCEKVLVFQLSVSFAMLLYIYPMYTSLRIESETVLGMCWAVVIVNSTDPGITWGMIL